MSAPVRLRPPGPAPDRRAALVRRVRLLVAATITYNVVEAVVAITAGTLASSTALIGFGLDSVIEVSSAAAVAWQFTGRDPQSRERVALRVIAISFFVLAGYITVESVRALVGGAEPAHSTVGLGLAALSLAVMPLLSYAQRRAGRELGSRSAVADSRQTLLCTWLSAVLLVGLGLNSLFGWSWADPVAALVIAAVAVREGREAWRGDTCCAVPLMPPPDVAETTTPASETTTPATETRAPSTDTRAASTVTRAPSTVTRASSTVTRAHFTVTRAPTTEGCGCRPGCSCCRD
ncbi:cation diffusion facilitator family transporter [Plantactinospora sp. WMMB782]|uniref:cation diffusion facilitator family transporter n=1 Tax=Plantactinospora sp. WMMB782 TaxID=3404121 RepID=UPI003B9642EA